MLRTSRRNQDRLDSGPLGEGRVCQSRGFAVQASRTVKKFCGIFWYFETGVHYVARAGPKLMILLSQRSEYQDYRQVSPGLVISCLSHSFVQLCSVGPKG